MRLIKGMLKLRLLGWVNGDTARSSSVTYTCHSQ